MKHRIFVIDDDAEFRESLLDALQHDYYDVIGFESGKDAIAALDDSSVLPSVVLVDLLLSDMPGFCVMLAIRQKSPQTQCIVLTGHASLESAVASVGMGAFGYLQKPCDKEQILVTVRQALIKTMIEQSRARAERRCRQLMDSSRDIVLEVGADMRLVYINPEGAGMFGAVPKALIGATLDEFIPSQACAHVKESITRILQTGESMECEETCHLPAGKIRLKMCMDSQRDTDGQIKSVIIFASEQTIAGADAFVWDGNAIDEAIVRDSSIPIRMLLVDDDVDSGQAMKNTLEARGVGVTIVPGAEEALELFNPSAIDVVVADIRLPGMSGIDLLGRIRRNFLDFPVILITGYDSLGSATQAVRLKAQDYILKPLNSIDDVLLPVKRAVDHYRLTQKNKALERDLRRSEQKWRSLVRNAPNTIAILDTAGVVKYINRAFSGFKTEELLGSSAFDHVRKQHLEGAHKAFRQVLEDGRYVTHEFEIMDSMGKPVWIEAYAGPIANEGKIVAVIVISQDITLKKQTAEALEMSRNNLRHLWSRYILLEENERKRLARELHDQIGQTMTALNLAMSVVRGRLLPGADKQTEELLKDASRQIEEMGGKIRNVMADLRPPVLDEYGLLAALRWYGGKFFKHTGIVVDIECTEYAPRLSLEVETSLFRIAQEAFNNVVKHASAKKVTVRIASTTTTVQMFIHDDGIGFHVADTSRPSEKSGWGLTTMKERAEAMDGRFAIVSGAGHGTQITVEIKRDG